MAIEWERAPQAVLDLARRIIDTHHEHLKTARIAFVFRSEAPVSAGKVTLGKAKKVSVEDQLFKDYDFSIWLAKDMWRTLSAKQREALIFHELCHCSWKDEVASIKPHDIEEFDRVLDLYGFWWPFSDRSEAAAEKAVQEKLPIEPSPDEPRREGMVGTVDMAKVAGIDFDAVARDVVNGLKAMGIDDDSTEAGTQRVPDGE